MRKFYNKVHFTGIGGAGMSSIAAVLLSRGCKVTGSDRALNEITNALAASGAVIYGSQDASNITDQDVVVYTSAADPSNPEILAAALKGIPVIKRSVMLGECMRYGYGIGISGTHGKSTTTTMVGLVLEEAGLDPTVIVGARSRAFGGSNARAGKGDFVVVEADEYDRTFLELSPVITVTTNIEAEHLDIYRDLDDIKDAFVAYCNKVPFYGCCVVCIDDPVVREVLPRIQPRTVTYGTREEADFRITLARHNQRGSISEVFCKGKLLGQLEVPVPGVHNALNALAAVAVGYSLGVPPQQCFKGISRYNGIERRLQVLHDKGLTIIDDYAHHPTEVAASLAAVRGSWNKKVVAVFQPHLYSRTRDFYREFAAAFQQADVLVCLDVYPARELPIPGVSGELIVNEFRRQSDKEVYYTPSVQQALELVMDKFTGGCVVVTMGAGDVNKIGYALLRRVEGTDE